MEEAKITLSDDETLDRVRKDVIALLYKQAFFAYILTKVKKVIDRRVPVAGVSVIDGNITLYINPEGYLRYTREERLFILIHEIMHIIFHHHIRKEKRDHGLWNLATDVAINQLIEAEYAHVPKDCLKVDSWKEKHGFVLPKGKNADTYYKLLSDLKHEIEMPDEMKNSPMGDGEDETSESSSSGGSMAPSFEHIHPTWEDSTEITEQLAEGIVRSMVEEAYKQANGSVPNHIKETIKEMLEPKINWRAILRNFIAKKRNTNKKATWKKRNRRLGSDVMGYKKNRKLHVAVAIDTSASLTQDDFAMFNAEIISIHQSGANVTVMECDVKVHEIYRYNKNVIPSFTGRGGTDFRPVFKAIEEKKDKLLMTPPDAVIFLTDGMGPAPEYFSIPTLWCLTKNGRKPFAKDRAEVSWGTVIHLDN